MGNFRRLVRPIGLLVFAGLVFTGVFYFYSSESDPTDNWEEYLKSTIDQRKTEVDNDAGKRDLETLHSDNNHQDGTKKFTEKNEKLPAILRDIEKYLGTSTPEISSSESTKTKKKKTLKKTPKTTSTATSTSTKTTTSTTQEPEVISHEEILHDIQQQSVEVTPKGWAYKGPENMRCSVHTMGCFLPAAESNVKKVYLLVDASESMTDWYCIQLCSKRAGDRSVFAGIRNGNECRCVFRVTFLITLELTDQCNLPCSGDESLKCGGPNDITMIYRVTSKCMPVTAESLPYLTSESSQLGCFWKPTDLHIYMEEYKLVQDDLEPRCVLHCERQGLVLAIPSYPDICYCGLTVKNFDLQNPVDDVLCKKHKMEYVMVYRTQVEDRRCSDKRFLKEGEWKRTVGLVTFPGSGNTWLRHLIESATGIYTGSRYTDPSLVEGGGYLGELLHMDSRKRIVVKSHYQTDIKNKTMLGALIHVYRNPYNAVLSEFNRRAAKGHTKILDSDHFDMDDFSQLSEGLYSRKWYYVTRNAVQSNLPKLIFSYEDLVKDPIYYSEKMARFILGDLLDEEDLQKRLLCLKLAKKGEFKRKHKPLDFDPYTNEAKNVINGNIRQVEILLEQGGYQPNIDYYKPVTHKR